jgi:ABC-type uncharacterized transport system auxiliary subunit
MIRTLALLLALGNLVGCASAPPAPVEVSRTVGVYPPNNLTGDRLMVAGTGLIDRYLRHASPVSVADVLVSETRSRLEEKGFEVAGVRAGRIPQSAQEAAKLASEVGLTRPVLYLEIRRWEPDAPTQADFVIVGLSMVLIDPSTGTVVWEAHRRAAPVATPGQVTVEAAYVTAARKVVKEMLAPLRPAPAPAER